MAFSTAAIVTYWKNGNISFIKTIAFQIFFSTKATLGEQVEEHGIPDVTTPYDVISYTMEDATSVACERLGSPSQQAEGRMGLFPRECELRELLKLAKIRSDATATLPATGFES